MIIFYFFLSVICVLPILLALNFRFYVSKKLAEPLARYTPKVSVIVPCKGVDVGFNQNISAIFEQDYPDYEIVFVTATEDDPAVTLLKELIDSYPEVPSKLVHSGIPETCSQINNNIIKALDNVRSESEVYVRMDSDSRPHPEFFQYLVAPLQSSTVGVATGFRWYKPVTGGLGSWLRSAWNAGGIPFLASAKSSFAWGGGMAFTKKVLKECNLCQRWSNSLIDDLTLTGCIKAQGLKVVFVPQCMSISHEDSTVKETIEWTNRQTLILRIYGMDSWASMFVSHAISNAFLVFGLMIAMLGLSGIALVSESWLLYSALCFLPLLIELAYILLMLAPLKKILPQEVSANVTQNLWRYFLISPLASLLILYNSLHSLRSRRVSWRGVTYELKSAHELVVLNNGSQRVEKIFSPIQQQNSTENNNQISL